MRKALTDVLQVVLTGSPRQRGTRLMALAGGLLAFLWWRHGLGTALLVGLALTVVGVTVHYFAQQTD